MHISENNALKCARVRAWLHVSPGANLGGERALADTALARQDEDFVLDIREALPDDRDVRIGLCGLAGGAQLLVRRAASGQAQAVCFLAGGREDKRAGPGSPFWQRCRQRAAERPDTHGTWLGQPAQADAFPACSDVVPGQCSGTSPSPAIGRNATAVPLPPFPAVLREQQTRENIFRPQMLFPWFPTCPKSACSSGVNDR
jgi:hypothetical protein